ncbi:MAG: outer membrane protein assembly factor BamD [Nitrospira sp.]|jgi:outer membrane protein assembly factor BamD|nr:outer membrane protein assembly factor BamD [Nitrospira sp.]
MIPSHISPSRHCSDGWRSIGLLALGLVLLSLLATACSSTPKEKTAGKKPIGGTDEQIFLGDAFGTEKNYDPNVIMKRGEAFFEKEEYAEALVEFNHFLDLHKTHILAPYAAFRIGETHFKMAKSIDRDPEPLQKAITALERMRKDFPNSRYDAQAQQKIQECHDWLAQTHLLVGQFYYRRESYLAAVHRFEQILKIYPDKPVAPDALYFLALSYHEMGADDWAANYLTLLAQKYPDSTVAGKGKTLLAKLGGSAAGMMAAKDPSAPTFADTPPSSPSGNGTALPDLSNAASTLNGLRLPSANSLGQAFTACRLGAWC